MKKYDLVVVLGLRFGRHWGLRADLKNRLDKVARLQKEGRLEKILVSGRWTIWFDWLSIKPPITEAQRMKKYLIKLGVPASDIIMETHSKDTIGNVYYLKLFLKDKPKIKYILVVCASQHEPRVRFLFKKFFAGSPQIVFLAIPASHYKQSALGSEKRLLAEQKEFLRDVRPGHEEDLRHRLYNSKYYRHQAKEIEGKQSEK